MRFSIIIALFASALVLASPVQDNVETVELSQAETLTLVDQIASTYQVSQEDAYALLEQYAAEEQDAEFIPLLRIGARLLPKVIPAIGRGLAKILPKVGKAAVKAAPEVAGATVDAATSGGEAQ